MTVEWTSRALHHIRAARAYIARDNPAAARAVTERIIDAVEALLSFSPRIGQAGRIEGTRELLVSRTPYIVVYTIGTDRVYVLAVLHHAQD